MTSPWIPSFQIPIHPGDRKALNAMCNLKGISPSESNLASQFPELRQFLLTYPHLAKGGSYEEELTKLGLLQNEKVEKKEEDSPKTPHYSPWHGTSYLRTPHQGPSATPWQHSEVTYNGVPVHSHHGFMTPGDAMKAAQLASHDKHGHQVPPMTYSQFYPYPAAPASPPRSTLSHSRPAYSPPTDPFSTSKHHPVLSLSSNPLGLSPKQASQIQLNPVLKKWPGPYPLAVDLRLPKSSIKYASKGDEEAKEWKDDDAPATIPMMDEIVLITPYLEFPIRVKNPRGVTCGDVLQALFDTAQRPTPENVWEKMREDQRAHVMSSWFSHREPMCTGSALPDNTLTNIDLLFDSVCFFGLYKDDEAAKAKVGFADPKCFVVELNRPLHKKEQYEPWTGLKRPFGW